MSEPHERLVGWTKDTGFQIGVRRTLPTGEAQAWEWVTSPEGLAQWLAEVDALDFQKGEVYHAAHGTSGEVRVYKPRSHLRITYHPPGWERPSTIQVRVMARGDRTTVAFHEEHLASADLREQRRAHFSAALDHLEAGLIP
ncbi:MAG: SRPBCC domain-containing protein [Chloroflexi bacterium]|nr:SRPBCC domain-containing protein [Chloroflexota bacterium]